MDELFAKVTNKHMADQAFDEAMEDLYGVEVVATKEAIREVEAPPKRGSSKSDFLSNSVQFDVHTWSEYPEVNNFVDAIYDSYFQGRKIRIKKKHLKVLLLHLYATWCDDPSCVTACSRNNNDYAAGTRYNELHISRLTINVMNTLIEARLVDEEIGFKDRTTGIGRYTRIWPTATLIEMFKKARFSPFDIISHQDRLSVILRDRDTDECGCKEIEYDPTEETERMSAMLREYNNLLASTHIDIPELENPWIDIETNDEPHRLFVNQRDKFVRRIFNRGSFDCGGRFWGGWWQRCPKDYRAKIFLDDQPTNEVDFSGLHIVMLYAEERVDYWEAVGDDPYKIPAPNFIRDEAHSREVAKLLILMLLNAKSNTQAYNAFRSRASVGSAEKSLKNSQLSEIHTLLERKHPLIAKHFGSDAGIRLMNRDAKITEIILQTFVQRSTPALSLHDSYVVPVGYEDFLIETMGQAFESVMGVPMMGHRDDALKIQSDCVEDLESALMYWMPYEGLPWQEQNEQAWRARVYPRKTQRYLKSWNSFQEWRREKGQ
ncbi:MAG: hypothetical protein GY791_01875 [Alphaproteobacteria bacterium]|nr:hypothetical protein [Alphaproteobacteria bacterium]